MATLKQDALIVAGIGLGVVVIAWYMKTRVSSAAQGVKQVVVDAWDASVDASKYVNPVRQENFINAGYTGMYRWMTGSDGTLGGDLYDATHGGILSDGTFNPTSNNNVVNRGAQSLYQWVTGSTGTIGGDIYDWFH